MNNIGFIVKDQKLFFNKVNKEQSSFRLVSFQMAFLFQKAKLLTMEGHKSCYDITNA